MEDHSYFGLIKKFEICTKKFVHCNLNQFEPNSEHKIKDVTKTLSITFILYISCFVYIYLYSFLSAFRNHGNFELFS